MEDNFYILVLPNFKDYCDRYGWGMRDFVGKIFIAEKIEKFQKMDCYRLKHDSEYNWEQTREFGKYGQYDIPLDASERVLGPDLYPDDSFGDDPKWWLEESLSNKLTLDDIKIGVVVKLRDDFIAKDTLDQEAKDASSEYGVVVGLFEYGPDPDDYPIRIKWSNGNEEYFYNVDDIEILNYKKQKNVEMDPFDEENWGYVKEQNRHKFVEKFHVGDQVRYTQERIYYLLNATGRDVSEIRNHGIIHNVDYGGNCKVRWDNGENTYNLQDDLELCNNRRSAASLEDPIEDQDKWWMNENYNEDIKIGDIVEIDPDKVPKDEHDAKYYARSHGGKGIVKYVSALTYGIEINWDTGHSGKYSRDEIILSNDIRRKRILNPEEDPFGEENWGYLDEAYIGDSDEYIYVKCDTYEELVEFFEILERLGYLWNSEHLPFQLIKQYKENNLFALNKTRKRLSCALRTKQHINFKDLNLDDLTEKYEDEDEDKWWMTESLDDNYKISVIFDTIEEYDKLMSYLDELDYRWNSGHMPSRQNYFSDKYPIVIRPLSKKLTIGGYDYDEINFKNLDLEKLKPKPRKLNLEDDPFGEENWGYLGENNW